MNNHEYDMLIASQKNASELPKNYVQASAILIGQDTYIDTNMTVGTGQIWEITCARTSADTTNRAVMGTSHAKSTYNFTLWMNPATNLVEFIFGNGSGDTTKVTTTAYNVNQMHTYRMNIDTGEAWIDGTYIGKAPSTQSPTNTSYRKQIVLFGAWRGSSMNSYYRGLVADCKIWENGQLVRHYVPCYDFLDTTTTAKLYDLSRSYTYSWTNLTVYYSINAEWEISVADNFTYTITSYSKHGNIIINWGDGTTETIAYDGSSSQNLSHTYTTGGVYTPSINVPFSTMRLGLGYDSTQAACVLKINKLKTGGFVPSYFCNAAINFNQPYLPTARLINTYSFYNNQTLNLIKLPEDVVKIDQQAFNKCSSLQIESLPSNLQIIEANAFNSCSSLAISEIPESVEEIKVRAFGYCSSLHTLVIRGQPNIASNAFANSSLQKVYFKKVYDSNHTIADYAFNGRSVTDIYCPWGEGEVAGAPWGATNATIHYNYVGEN